jgi:hypothetical protein
MYLPTLPIEPITIAVQIFRMPQVSASLQLNWYTASPTRLTRIQQRARGHDHHQNMWSPLMWAKYGVW